MAAVVAMLAGAVLFPAAASADTGDLITFRVEGTVTDIYGVVPAGFALGDPFVVTYEFDSSVADSSEPEDINNGIYNAITSVSVQVGSYEVTGTDGIIYVADQTYRSQHYDSYHAYWTDTLTGDPLVSSQPPGSPEVLVVPQELTIGLQDRGSDASVLEDDSLPLMPLDPDSFQRASVNLGFVPEACTADPIPIGLEASCQSPTGYIDGPIESMTLVVADPDADGDGVDDAIGSGGGVFDDDNGTTGTVGDPGGLDVFVTDVDPGGVRITATGSGGPAVVQVCGFTINLSSGSEATITCGSVTVEAAAGEVTVLLGGGDTVVIPEGGGATVDQLVDGTVLVDNFGPTDVEVTVRGVAATVASEESAVFPPDADNDGVVDGDDACPATLPLGSATTDRLKKTRYAVDASGTFVSGNGTDSGYTIADTAGCDEHQIIEALGLGVGHTRFGLSGSALDLWLDYINP